VAPPEIDTELGEVLAVDEVAVALAIAAAIRRNVEAAYPPGKRPARRDAHPKAHGCVRGTFRVDDELPAELRQGLFVAGVSYPCWVRFSNGDGNPLRPDTKGDSHGMAIKLLGVPGEKILPSERDERTQDFLMIDHPVFVVDDPACYLKLIRRASSSNFLARLTAPFAMGLRGALNARAIMSTTIASPLETRYWSTTAYRLGRGPERLAIKFSARPCLPAAATRPAQPDPNFLRGVMAQQLAERPFRFEFLVQARTDPALSVERSTVEWPESIAPFQRVATIELPPQTFTSPDQDRFGENLSFTPWHALHEHRPLGRVNRVRRVVYEAISQARHDMNGVPRREPSGEESFER
jgi:catalase